MKIAHLADLHLGFRQYVRQTPAGINQREADVAQAFRRALDGVAAERPDMVIIAGDLFHSVRPTNAAILDSFNQFRRLRAALPGVPVVIVAGNHDTPRSVETGTILRLFEAIDGVHVVATGTRRLTFPDLETSVLCVSHAGWIVSPRPALDPDAESKWNVLVMHGEVPGVFPDTDPLPEYGGAVLDLKAMHSEEWSYVALGHYHVATEVRQNVWYSGSLEYVSTNPWGEATTSGAADAAGAKGWLLVELGRKPKVRFRAVPLARRVIDLPWISAAGRTADEIMSDILEVASSVSGGIDGQIVRQIVEDVPRPTARDLDHAAIRELKTRALHYYVDLRKPAPSRRVGVGGSGRRQTVGEIMLEHLENRALPPDLPRDRLVTLGRKYLDEVDQSIEEG